MKYVKELPPLGALALEGLEGYFPKISITIY
jgi:hypothetical protein